jgi:CheY-like chemotaxis protein
MVKKTLPTLIQINTGSTFHAYNRLRSIPVNTCDRAHRRGVRRLLPGDIASVKARVMNSPVFGVSPFSGSPALVVEPEEHSRVFLASSLSSAGLSVTGTGSFSSARALLEAQPPALLVTEVRLGAYNGLHLVLLGRSVSPHMTLVVTSRLNDRGLQREAEELGATFIRKPMTAWALLAPLYRAAFASRMRTERTKA